MTVPVASSAPGESMDQDFFSKFPRKVFVNYHGFSRYQDKAYPDMQSCHSCGMQRTQTPLASLKV